MARERRFLIAPSFARLIQRESRFISRIVEGHLPTHTDRFQLVRVEHERALLILAQRDQAGQMIEEQASIPHAHAEALIDVAAGAVAFDEVVVELSGEGRALLARFVLPNGIDVITTVMEDRSNEPLPARFGPEVTGRPKYERRSLAIEGLPVL